jgi:hypothetical protein
VRLEFSRSGSTPPRGVPLRRSPRGTGADEAPVPRADLTRARAEAARRTALARGCLRRRGAFGARLVDSPGALRSPTVASSASPERRYRPYRAAYCVCVHKHEVTPHACAERSGPAAAGGRAERRSLFGPERTRRRPVARVPVRDRTNWRAKAGLAQGRALPSRLAFLSE